MKNTKLYVLQQNGIVKLGITSNEDVQTRITQINKDLPEDKKFQLVVEFEVNESPAMIERFVHDYLGVNQLNIQYLKNKMVLVDVDYVNSSQTGYTEFFLADKDKIKQVITLFGILDYINVDTQNLNKLNEIKEYSFDFFADKHPEFLKMCESALRINQNGSNYIKSTLVEALTNTSDKIKADFIIEDNRYFLLLGDKKISLEELTNPNNKQYIEFLLTNKDVLEVEKKETTTLYSIIREFREKNKETSLQPLTSMQKELKDKELHDFMDNNKGWERIYDLVSLWDNGNGPFAYELLGYKSVYHAMHDGIISENTELTSQQIKTIQKNKVKLEKKGIMKPNFDSPILVPDYIKLIQKDNTVLENSEIQNELLQSTKIITSILKILYNSKNKEEEIKHIYDFMGYIDDYYKHIEGETLLNPKEMPVWKIEREISEIMNKNSSYLDLAIAEISLYPYSGKTENKMTNILNKLKK